MVRSVWMMQMLTECSAATLMFSSLASTPVTSAPRRARGCVKEMKNWRTNHILSDRYKYRFIMTGACGMGICVYKMRRR